MPGTAGPGSGPGWTRATACRRSNSANRSVWPGCPRVDVPAVRQQDHPVGPQLVERPGRLAGGGVEGRQRHRGEEAEAVGMVLGQLGAYVVDGSRHVLGLGVGRRRGDARGRDGQQRPRRPGPVHRGHRGGRAPLRHRDPAHVEDAVRGQPTAVGVGNHVLVDVDPAGRRHRRRRATAPGERRRGEAQRGPPQHVPSRQLTHGAPPIAAAGVSRRRARGRPAGGFRLRSAGRSLCPALEVGELAGLHHPVRRLQDGDAHEVLQPARPQRPVPADEEPRPPSRQLGEEETPRRVRVPARPPPRRVELPAPQVE